MPAPRPRYGRAHCQLAGTAVGDRSRDLNGGGPPTPWPVLWTCRRPGECAAPHPSRYIHPVPSPRVGRYPAVDGGEGAYIYIRICSRACTWRWDISPRGRRPPSCRRPSRYPPRASLFPIVAPRSGVTPVPRDPSPSMPPAARTGPRPTGQHPGCPGLAPCLTTVPKHHA